MSKAMICPACGVYGFTEDGFKYREMTRGSPLTARSVFYVACFSCGLVGKFPMPPEEELKLYYESSWQYGTTRPEGVYWRSAWFIARGLRDADGAGNFPACAGPRMGEASRIGDGTVLEVGSKGSQMAQELAMVGVPVESAGGLDAQPKASGVAQAWLGSGNGPQGNHSIVCAAHILEHVLRPDLFLMDLAGLTADGGYIYIEVPSLRGGLQDVGICDDLNRNHLWHFGPMALARLAQKVGVLVLLETDIQVRGWPTDRMLIRKVKPVEDSIRCIDFMARDIGSEYDKAASKIAMESQRNVGLYGASHSYAQLVERHPDLLAYRVFDKYKAGEQYKLSFRDSSRPIEPLDKLKELLGAKVYVTTRSYNSYLDIKADLAKEFPWLLVKTPYANLAEAIEEAP